MRRISQLDGLRALAILCVFLRHAFNIKLLWMGVDLFFIQSGFLITGVLLSAKQHALSNYFAQFYARRARRIVAPYLISLLVLSLFFGFAWTHYAYFYFGLMNFLRPLNIPHPVALDPLWSLAVEEQFYVVWPFAVYFLPERWLAWLAAVLLFLAPVLRGTFHFEHHWPIYMLTPFRMDLLAVGALIYLLYHHRRSTVERWGLPAGVLFTGTGVAGLFALSRYGVSTYSNTRLGNVAIYECCLFTCLGVMLWALSGVGVAVLKWNPLTYIGRISYTMYLIHLGVLVLLGARFTPAVAGALGFLITVVYAAASWHLVEQPLLAKRRAPTPAARAV